MIKEPLGQGTTHESAKIPKRRFYPRLLIHAYLQFKDDLDQKHFQL